MDDSFEREFVAAITEAQLPIRSYIAKLTGSNSATDDVLQKTNLILWEKRMHWDPTTVFLKWAYRIAYFQVKAHHRDEKREKRVLAFDSDLLELLSQDEPSFEEPSELQEALAHCLRKMNKDRRTLLNERYAGMHSVDELAGKYGRSPNALSQLLCRLRSKLSDCIELQIEQTPAKFGNT